MRHSLVRVATSLLAVSSFLSVWTGHDIGGRLGSFRFTAGLDELERSFPA